MKCLSVSQPFADLIVSGRKTIELRSWNTGFRGEFLVHAPLKVRTGDCKRLKLGSRHVTGAIIGKAELYGVKEYNSKREIRKDQGLHFAGRDFHDRTRGFLLRNSKPFRVPIPAKGRLGFFDVVLPKAEAGEIITDIIDEEYRYQWVGHH